MTYKYFVGIDLGTTNSSVAYSRAEDSQSKIEQYKIHQLVSEGLVDALEVLPSLIYIPSERDFPEGSLELPWNDRPKVVIGEMARREWSRAGYKVVHSAKSWLCHNSVDPKESILPFKSTLDDEKKISAFEATQMILRHIKDSWNYDVEVGALEGLLEDQSLVITIPASFDPAARDATLEAAHSIGLRNVLLLEEPQSALYSWIESQGDNWRDNLEVGRSILVCDIGGGTTDFSLMKTVDEEGSLGFKRIAVGNHILLGGDNMDLALSHLLKAKLKESGQTPDDKQFSSLQAQAREAKELIFGGDQDEVKVVLAGSGSSLFASSMETLLTRSEVDKVVLDGFFASVEHSDRPRQNRGLGLRDMGLHYATDAAIFKHLAQFLGSQDEEFHKPDLLLFNGSMFRAEILRDRVRDVLNMWPGDEVSELESRDFRLAVSRGATYYSRVSSGEGIRIKASLAYSYYVGVEKAEMAIPGMEPELSLLCIAPHGTEEGSRIRFEEENFYLVTGETSQFRLFRSAFRHDSLGQRLTHNEEEFEELSSLEKALEADSGEQYIPVVIETDVTEIGTLDLFCASVKEDDKRWKLEFQVRDAA